ncbi:hemagglutinin, partial [Anaeroglobus geminatus F0357]
EYDPSNIKTMVNSNGEMIVGMDKNLKADSIAINGKDGKDGATIKGGDGKPGVDGTNITRLIIEEKDGKQHDVATLDDGLKFAGNTGIVAKKLNSTMTIKGTGTKADTEYDPSNIKTMVDSNGEMIVGLDKNLKVETITAGKDGKDGKVGVAGANGKDGVTITAEGPAGQNGVDGHIGINGKDGTSADIHVKDGAPGVDGAPGTHLTRIVYEDKNHVTHEVATLDDGMKYGGDTGAVIKKKLNGQVNVVGGITDTSKLTDDDNIGVVSDGSDNLKIRLAKDVNLGPNGSLTINGKTYINKDGLNANSQKITNVANGTVNSDAVNFGQLKDAVAAGKTILKDGKNTTVEGEGTVANPYKVNVKDDLVLGEKGANGKDGSIGVNGKDGSAVVINGKDGSIGMNGKDGANGLTIKGGDGKPGVDGTNITRLIIEEKDGKQHDIATLDDGMKYGGDTGDVIKKKLNEQVNVIGGIKDESKLTTDDNIGVVSDGNNNLKVRLAKDIKLNSVTAGNVVMDTTGFYVKNTTRTPAGTGTVSLTADGLNNGGNKIANVAAGEADTDAVNVSQLKNQGSEIINKGFGIKAEDGNEVKKKLGESVDVVGDGKNISTRVEGGKVKVTLKDDIFVKSVNRPYEDGYQRAYHSGRFRQYGSDS